MNEVLAALVVAGVVAWWTARQVHVLRAYRRWHGLPAFPSFRGLRLVVNRGGRVARPAKARGLIPPATIAAHQVQRLTSAPTRINGQRVPFRSLGAAVNRDLDQR